MTSGISWEGCALGRRMLLVDRGLSLVAALAATACAALHVVLLIERRDAASLLMLLVALLCLGCAWHGLRHPGAAMWVWMVVGSLTMLALHLFAHGGSHAHGGAGADTGASTAAPGASAVSDLALAMSYTELCTALMALVIGGVAMRLAPAGLSARRSPESGHGRARAAGGRALVAEPARSGVRYP